MRIWIATAVLLALLTPALKAQDAETATILGAMKAELARSLRAFKAQPVQPYFLSYEITDDQVVGVTGTFGKLQTSQQSRSRQLDIDLRVGTPHLDNTHGTREGAAEASAPIYVPIEADPDALRSVLWYHTDLKYKQAVEQLAAITTEVQVKVAREDKSDDFSPEPAAKHFDQPRMMKVDKKSWEERVRKYTEPFAHYGDIYSATANFLADIETRWYVNSDGSEIAVSRPLYYLYLSAQMKADDGMDLPRYESFYSSNPEGLPSDQAVLKIVDQMIKDLQALRVAPIVDPYTGPAILSGRASGVFFHEVFGHRIEGHRQKDENEGQTFKKMVGEKLLPENFSVVSDPTLQRLGSAELAGFYDFDNEGVKAQRVVVLDHGVFKNFLMSRSPIEGFPHSNGHGRRQQGNAPVARQSNLIVIVDHPGTRAELKQRLIEEVKKQNQKFGLFFDDIQGGFTLTSRFTPNAFNVLPIMVYRIYPDGREELVRGVNLIGTPLTAFSKIVAGDADVATFNGVCGAESGSVPVSASSPDLLVSQIEVAKKEKSTARAPILPAPIQWGRVRLCEEHARSKRMQKTVSRGLGILLLAAMALPAPAPAADDVVMRAMRDELDRSMKQLQLEQLEKPYFISYRVQERTSLDTSATFGALLSGSLARARYLTVQVRVGDYQSDNSNFMTYPPQANGLTENVLLPLDDDYQELRRQIWLATDTAYKEALEMLSRKRGALENRKARENLPDFSKEQPATALEPFALIKMDLAQAESLVRNLSALFRQSPEIYTSSTSLGITDTRSWYLNSEGSAVTEETSGATFMALAQTQAIDGTMLPDWVMASAHSMEALPKEADLASQIRTMADRLTRVRQAPVVDRYNGPVLFDGAAGAEVFSQVFVPKLLAMRAPASDNPQMEAYAAQSVSKLQDRLGARVLPSFLSVVDDPTQGSYQGTPLVGSHAVDDEGVRARPTTLVDKGYLKTLLNARDPVSGIPQSTGSFRTFGAQPSNLMLTVTEGASKQELKDQLLSMVKQRNKEFGVVVRGVGREIDKVYPDGHEELMRLGQFDGLDDGAFKDLAAASRDLTVYNIPYAAYGGRLYPGQTGAPLVSFVAPSLLFEDLTLKPAAGELPRLPLSKHPYFDK